MNPDKNLPFIWFSVSAFNRQMYEYITYNVHVS
jgi:hypothetical protein